MSAATTEMALVRAAVWNHPEFRFTLGRRSLPEIIRRLNDPLLAMLRLGDAVEGRSFEPLAARVIEQQSRMLEELTNLTEELLSIMDSSPPSRIYSVILVSEDASILNSLRIALLCSGCRVLAFHSAEAAVLRLQSDPQTVDLVITELELAGKEDGLLLVESLRRKLLPGVPAVVLSTTESATLREPLLMQNIQVLCKPLNLVTLRQTVGTLLQAERNHHAKYGAVAAGFNHHLTQLAL